VLPASAYAETLVEPHERGPGAVRQVDAFLAALPARVEAIDAKVAKAAARLRARHSRLKLPDAMVIATAELLKADRVLTTDRGWPGGLGVVVHIVGQGTQGRRRR
jgi:PIN domain nuclease of toxin-antitoxin system